MSSTEGGQSEPSARHSLPPVVSIVITNHNYAPYVGQAIKSALAQTYPHVEVIVVDDGSSDDSRDVISRFGDRVVAVMKPNGGHASAFNAGFEHATGSMIMFLDSDDYLMPTAVARVVSTFAEGVVKVQFRLMVIDGEGRRTGEHPPPDAPLHRGDVVPLLLKCGEYSTPVCSGNAYSRSVLESVFPVPAEEFRIGPDGYVNAVVPFFGSVAAIDETLGAYRIHGRNASPGTSGLNVRAFRTIIDHQLAVERVIVRTARAAGYTAEPGLILRSVGHLDARLISLRLDSASHPIAGDRRLKLAALGVLATWRYLDIGLARRLVNTGSFIAAGLLPLSLARPTISWRYERSSRPRAIQLAVRTVRRLTG